MSFVNVRVLPFATGFLPEFLSAKFFWGLCPGVGGSGPQALGIRRPQGPACGGREELKGISAGNSLKTLPGACGQIVQVVYPLSLFGAFMVVK